jgi:hypothetical protein
MMSIYTLIMEKTLDEFYCNFEGFKPLFHPCLIEDKSSNKSFNMSMCCLIISYVCLLFNMLG